MKPTKAEKMVIKLLKKIEQYWPDSLWLLAEGGNIHVMRTGDNGEHVTHKHTGGIDESFILETISIDSDGAGW